MVLELVMSLAMFLCPLRVNITVNFTLLLMSLLVLTDIILVSSLKNNENIMMWTDTVAFVLTITLLIVTFSLLINQMRRRSTELFMEQKVKHTRTLY